MDFLIFWNTYNLKRDKVAAERAWKRLSAKDKKAALEGVARYRDDCAQRGISMMYAQGYLNHRRWEDDPAPSIVNGKTANTSPVNRTPEYGSHDGNGYRVRAGITEKERACFNNLRRELYNEWNRHRDEENRQAIICLLRGLDLNGVNDDRKTIRIESKDSRLSTAAPWYWAPGVFDTIVARHFNGYTWIEY